MTKKIILTILALVMAAVCCNHTYTVDCSKRGSHSIFVADFENDTVGSLPAPATPLHYGPPGASLDVQDGSNTVEIVNSTTLGSNALKITRGGVLAQPTEVEAVAGIIDAAPNSAGVYYIEFTAHGEIVPEYLIAGIAISVRDSTGKAALSLKLYNSAYHFRVGESYTPLTGSYDPSTSHFVHIELNLDTRKYSICIDNQAVASNKPLFTSDFEDLHSLKFFAPSTITEAFQMVYVIDEIRITK